MYNLNFFHKSSPPVGIVKLSKSVRMRQAIHVAQYSLLGVVSCYIFVRFKAFTATNIILVMSVG
jgi:hypothetical protein